MSQDLSGNLRLSGGCVGLDGQAPPFVVGQGSLKRPAVGFPDASGIYEEVDGNNLCIETAGVKRARFDANGLNLGTHSMTCGAMSSSSMTITDLEVTHSFTSSNTNSAFAVFQGNASFNKGITVLNSGIVNQGVLNNTGYPGTFGALTTTSIDNGTGVLQTGYMVNRLQFPTTLTVAAWYKAGNWTSTQQGANFKMEIVAGRNYAASTDMSTVQLYSRMFNQSGVTPNIFGHFFTVSTVSTISSPIQRAKWKATTANGTTCQSWDLYVLVETYLGPDHFYKVDVGPNATWTHIMTADSDPGSDSSTVIACRANAALGCPSNTAGGSSLYFGIVGHDGISQYVGSTNVEWAGSGGKSFYVPVDCGTNTLTCGAVTCGAITSSGSTQQFGSSYPVYIHNNYPTLGYNALYNGGWKFGAGSSSQYGGLMVFDISSGAHVFYTSNATGSAGNTLTPTNTAYLDRNGVFVVLGGIQLPTSGGTPATLNYFETGSFSVTWQSAAGGGTTSTQTVYFVAIGNSASQKLIVTMYIPGGLITTGGTGGKINWSTTATPSRLRPAVTAPHVLVRTRSNVTFQTGMFFLLTTGGADLYYDTGGFNFPISTANSGLENGFCITYNTV